MSYLRSRRTHVILGSFLLFAVLMSAFPAIDIHISRLFFREGAFVHDQWWQKLLHDGLNAFLLISVGTVSVLYACNKLLKQNIGQLNGRRMVYLLLVLIVGAGLIVNVALKDHAGRARPRDIAEFGGTKHFSPPFVVSHECRANCSFSSGDAAGAFFSIALAMALTRRRRYLVTAVAFGALISASRLIAGAHFFSDVVTSFFIMLILADVLHHYVVSAGEEREVARDHDAGAATQRRQSPISTPATFDAPPATIPSAWSRERERR